MILLVENDPVLRRAIRSFLDLAGYGVVESERVEDAGDAARSSARIDAVVAELDTPGPPIEELTRLARRLHPRVVMIACSSRTSLARRSSLRAAGVDAIIPKVELTTHLLPELAARFGP